MRRGALLQMVVIGLVAVGVGIAIALAVPWLPPAASKEAHRIYFVTWFTVGICIGIMGVVASVITYCVLHFRARPDDMADGPSIHGHTGLEIAWTLIPFLLVTAIAIVSAIVLGRNDNVGPNPLRVDVTAQQFAWSFQYPKGEHPPTQGLPTYFVLRLPVDTSIDLHLHSLDVIHSFWVPELAQKQDAVPGLVPTLHITPTKVGTYPLICTELCGLGHAAMRSTVIVMSKADFAKWQQSQTAAASGSGAALGKTVFTNSGCGACHTLSAAGSTGKIGPDLDKLAQSAAAAHQSLAAFTKQSIVDPNAYIAPGYPRNVMPQTFGKMLSQGQLAALVQFVDGSGKKG